MIRAKTRLIIIKPGNYIFKIMALILPFDFTFHQQLIDCQIGYDYSRVGNFGLFGK